jgi:hypothetical protein
MYLIAYLGRERFKFLIVSSGYNISHYSMASLYMMCNMDEDFCRLFLFSLLAKNERVVYDKMCESRIELLDLGELNKFEMIFKKIKPIPISKPERNVLITSYLEKMIPIRVKVSMVEVIKEMNYFKSLDGVKYKSYFISAFIQEEDSKEMFVTVTMSMEKSYIKRYDLCIEKSEIIQVSTTFKKVEGLARTEKVIYAEACEMSDVKLMRPSIFVTVKKRILLSDSKFVKKEKFE